MSARPLLSTAASPAAGDGGRRPAAKAAKKPRLESLDAARGLTIMTMILVDYAGDAWPMIDHCPWDGVRLADFVMPSFDFIVGVACTFVFRPGGSVMRPGREPEKLGDTLWHGCAGKAHWWYAFKKATVRFVKLFILGVLTQGGISFYQFDLAHVRTMGILQRVALCYITAALMEIFLGQHRPDTKPHTAGDTLTADTAGIF